MNTWAGLGAPAADSPLRLVTPVTKGCVAYVGTIWAAYAMQLCVTGNGLSQGTVTSCSCFWLHAMLQRSDC